MCAYDDCVKLWYTIVLWLCTTIVHSHHKHTHMSSSYIGPARLDNTAVNSSDNLPSYPPDNHHSSDNVYWRGYVVRVRSMLMRRTKRQNTTNLPSTRCRQKVNANVNEPLGICGNFEGALKRDRSVESRGEGSRPKACFHYGCALRCMARDRDADNVSISLATQCKAQP